MSEQTPLLQAHHEPSSEESQEHEEGVLKEPNMRELVVIMSSIWLGVFLAALGTSSSKPVSLETNPGRHNNRRYPNSSHLLVLQLLLSPLLAGHVIFNLKCRLPTA